MKCLPDRDETLALVAVWLMWPALHFAAWAVHPLFSQLSGCLPLPTRLAFQVLQANRLCIPSLIGTTAIVLVSRLTPTSGTRHLLLHLITLLAFGFTVLIMLVFLTVARTIV